MKQTTITDKDLDNIGTTIGTQDAYLLEQLNIMSGEYVVQGVTLSHEIANKWKELFIGKVRIGSAVYPMRRYHMMRLLKDIEVTTER